jgi:hypothetical protein
LAARELMRLVVLVFLAASAFGADLNVPSRDLYAGWLKMYDLKFDDAHQIFGEWKQSHPADALGPASDAAAYLFSELARLGILESELFTDDAKFQNRAKPRPDPQLRPLFDREIGQTEHLADAALQTAPADANALFAKSLTFGLRADFASLIEKQDFAALRFTKQGRAFTDKLTAINPNAYDAYLGVGIENYLLSLKPAPLRALLWVTGSQVDREKGLENLRKTAQYGHYLAPFAKLLLAVAALRDNNRSLARELLTGLHNRFPDNPLYLSELDRLTPKIGPK